MQEVSTLSINEQTALYYAPNTLQTTERELPSPPPKGAFLKYILEAIENESTASSVNLDLQVPDVTDETASTTFMLFEPRFTLPHILYRNAQVKSFLTRYPEIKEFLKEAQPALFRYFGYPVDIVLEVMTYPEDQAYDELVGWIQSNDDVSEGIEKLESFEDEWLIEQLNKVGNRFNFNIEFK